MSLEINFKFDMGRKLEKISWSAFFFFSKDNNIAVFSEFGITPCESQQLIIMVKISNKMSLYSFMTHAGKRSKEQYFFCQPSKQFVNDTVVHLAEGRQTSCTRNRRKRCNTKIRLEIFSAKVFAKALSSAAARIQTISIHWSNLLIDENRNFGLYELSLIFPQ